MNKIRLKEWEIVSTLRNVKAALIRMRNNVLDGLKRAKKEKDEASKAMYTKQLSKCDSDLMQLGERITKAEQDYEVISLECAIKRTKIYVLAYSLQGAVFELKEFLKKHAVRDGGEIDLIDEMQRCCNILMKMPTEFGHYSKDNESYNICEEIISEQVDRGVRAAFDEMLSQELNKLKQKYGKQTIKG